MAWGTPQIGTRTASNVADPLSLNLPSYSAGDILFAVVAERPTVGGTGINVAGFTAGYTLLKSAEVDSGKVHLAIWAKVAGGGESAPSCDLNGANDSIGIMFSVSGGPTTISVASDIVDDDSVVNNGYGATYNISQLQPGVDNCLILWAVAGAFNNWTTAGCTRPSGSSDILVDNTNSNYAGYNGVNLEIGYAIQTTKANTGNPDQYIDGSSPPTHTYVSIGLALKSSSLTVTPTMGRCIYILP